MFVGRGYIHGSLAIEQKPKGKGHPNKVPFEGILFYVDIPSENAPHGTGGRRLLIPRDVTEKALPTLVGMPVNIDYDDKDSWDNFDGHDPKKPIGIIEKAWIETAGSIAKVSGYLFAKNFPEEVDKIKDKKESLGMSLETTETLLQDFDWNGETVAKAVSIVFTGAAILYKWGAAYQNSSIAANANKGKNSNQEGSNEKLELKDIMDAIGNMKTELTAHVDTTVKAGMEGVKKEFDAKLEEVKASVAAAAATPPTKTEAEVKLEAEIEDLKKKNAELEATKTAGNTATPPAAGGDPPTRKTVESTGLLAKYSISGAAEDGKDVDVAATIDKVGKQAGLDNATIMAMKLAARSEGMIK